MMIIAASLMTLMVACNDEEVSQDVESVLNDSIDAMEELSSYSMKVDSTQSMVVEEESMDIESSIEMDLLLEPLTLFQKTSFDLGDMGMGMDMSLEYDSYFSEEEGFFMQDPFANEWAKFSNTVMDEMMEEALALSDAQLSPEEQLKPFKEYISDLSIIEEEDHYVISLKGEGADMSAFAEQISTMAGEGMDELFEDIWNDMEIHALEYEIFIDKETYYQTEANVYMEMTMNIEEESMTLEQTSHMVLSQFNELDDLQIPEEVLENAEEISDEGFLGEF